MRYNRCNSIENEDVYFLIFALTSHHCCFQGHFDVKICQVLRVDKRGSIQPPCRERNQRSPASPNVEPPSTEPCTAKFFKILEYTQLTVRQISSGSSQNWSIGTGSTHVPRASIQNQRARASTKRKKTIK